MLPTTATPQIEESSPGQQHSTSSPYPVGLDENKGLAAAWFLFGKLIASGVLPVPDANIIASFPEQSGGVGDIVRSIREGLIELEVMGL